MNLAEKFAKESEIEKDMAKKVKDEVENEIVEYFKGLLTSGTFENWLENNLTKDNKLNRKKDFKLAFWSYASRCSETHFSLGSFIWTNPEARGYESNFYKKVDLRDIQKTTGRRILNYVVDYLKELGFKVKVTDMGDEKWSNHFTKLITISW